jgi:hypothetical protein
MNPRKAGEIQCGLWSIDPSWAFPPTHTKILGS